MVGFVNALDPGGKVVFVMAALPQFAQARKAARYQAKTRPGAPPRRIASHPVRRAATKHLPVDIVGSAVEIDHRARRIGDQQHGPGCPGNFHGEQVDIAVFQPQRGKQRIAHPLKQRARIGPAGMRHRDEDRNCRWHRALQGKGMHARGVRRCAGDLTARQPLRIAGRIALFASWCNCWTVRCAVSKPGTGKFARES